MWKSGRVMLKDQIKIGIITKCYFCKEDFVVQDEEIK
jgi:hypothetical protein